ncbi:sialate O-acetylesterase [Clostridium sp.]|uniref:sialate O-acetylesterase n=1 Tax=Clostridium sp. TaxID=1506 RepID=UPI00262FA7A7|nr:sialate O-acetylesterase [uncultured Clostridium sp.]
MKKIKVTVTSLQHCIVSAKAVDLVMFMGQSNMAGRGTDLSVATSLNDGEGYEFRAISDPTKLYKAVEPFGVNENNASGIAEVGMKTGSPVTSFMKSYYKYTKVPIVGISASKGGSAISTWQPNGAYLNDSIGRLDSAKTWLKANGYRIRRCFMVWLQGETDGDNNTTKADYTNGITAMIEEMVNNQEIEKCFLIRIGNHRDLPSQYDNIISAQTDLCRTYNKAVMISTRLTSYAVAGLMKDTFHYFQPAYNEFGTEAGANTAFYVNNVKEPTMYDTKYDSLYFTHKN